MWVNNDVTCCVVTIGWDTSTWERAAEECTICPEFKSHRYVLQQPKRRLIIGINAQSVTAASSKVPANPQRDQIRSLSNPSPCVVLKQMFTRGWQPELRPDDL